MSVENKMLTLYTSSVTHEMVSPLQCVCHFAVNILKAKPTRKVKEFAELIVSTT
jgi:hypothetical protein